MCTPKKCAPLKNVALPYIFIRARRPTQHIVSIISWNLCNTRSYSCYDPGTWAHCSTIPSVSQRRQALHNDYFILWSDGDGRHADGRWRNGYDGHTHDDDDGWNEGKYESPYSFQFSMENCVDLLVRVGKWIRPTCFRFKKKTESTYLSMFQRKNRVDILVLILQGKWSGPSCLGL